MTKHNENNVPVGEASLLVISLENDDCRKYLLTGENINVVAHPVCLQSKV